MNENKNIAETNKREMERLYRENQALTDTQTIRKMAGLFIEEIKNSGDHFCIHESDMGSFKTMLGNIDKKTDELIEAKNEHAKRITKLEMVVAATGLVMGASWAVFIWLAEKVTWK